MEDVTRRGFVGTLMTMGAAVTIANGAVVKAAQAEPETVVPVEPFDPSTHFDAGKSDELLQQVLDESEVVGDLTLEDGTVIPEVYVRLRNRINRMGKGIGSNPGPDGWQMIMYLWSEEDAAHELEMPMLKCFTPYDYACVSGRTEEECAEILKDMASRCLIYHLRRGGADYYELLPHVNGFWEFAELREYFDRGLEGVKEFNEQGVWDSNGAGYEDFDNTFPLFRTYPISADVVAEDELAPYNDWRAIIRRHQTITVSPCQCRIMFESQGVPYPEEFPQRTCLSLGEMAEYFIENGIGEQITQDEAIAIYEDIIDKGMVVESICTKDADIMCCCHGSACGNLMGFKATAGQNKPAGKNFNAYNLEYDPEVCIGCGACVERCPMEAISLDDDNKCVHNDVCVRCGQCVSVCPASARILRLRDDWPELPNDYLECHQFIAKERMYRGAIVDTVPEA